MDVRWVEQVVLQGSISGESYMALRVHLQDGDSVRSVVLRLSETDYNEHKGQVVIDAIDRHIGELS
jgi:hypothetical protein